MSGQQTIPQDPLAGISAGLQYQGTWDATLNDPFLQDGIGTQNHYYIVSVAGNTPLDGESDWEIGDWVIFNGTKWQKIDQSDAVTAVFTRTGAVTAQAGDYTHAQLAAVGTDDHHAKSHAHDGVDGSGTVAHVHTTGQGTDDHHAMNHRDRHVSTGPDSFLSTDLIEAIVRRIREAGGPTTLQIGTINANELLYRVGAAVVSLSQITDSLHGNRGGGALHALATALVAGFMSAADKAKLDVMPKTDIGGFTFGDQGGAGVSKAGAGYQTKRYWSFPGTTRLGITGFDVKFIVEKTSGPNTGNVRIYDVTNGATIAEYVGINDAAPTIRTVVAANLPTGEALWRLDLEGGIGTTVYCYGAQCVK